jgi:microcystin-dependent protein
LFSLLGTTFGGDGRVNFALPNNKGRTPIHVGAGHTLGERGGEQAHTLNIAEIPQHTHTVGAYSTSNFGGNVSSPTNNTFSTTNPAQLYKSPAGAPNLVPLNPGTVTNVGGSQAHLNMQPFLTLSFCIALQGIFPSPT